MKFRYQLSFVSQLSDIESSKLLISLIQKAKKTLKNSMNVLNKKGFDAEREKRQKTKQVTAKRRVEPGLVGQVARNKIYVSLRCE